MYLIITPLRVASLKASFICLANDGRELSTQTSILCCAFCINCTRRSTIFSLPCTNTVIGCLLLIFLLLSSDTNRLIEIFTTCLIMMIADWKLPFFDRGRAPVQRERMRTLGLLELFPQFFCVGRAILPLLFPFVLGFLLNT